jgi:hypothetical protein
MIINDKGKRKIKGKGAYDLTNKKGSINSDFAIVTKALINYLVDGVDPLKTINECQDILDFCLYDNRNSNYNVGLFTEEQFLNILKDDQEKNLQNIRNFNYGQQNLSNVFR